MSLAFLLFVWNNGTHRNRVKGILRLYSVSSSEKFTWLEKQKHKESAHTVEDLLKDTLLREQLYLRLACEAGGTVLRVLEYFRRRSPILHQLRSSSAKTLRLQRRIPRQLRRGPTSALSKPRYSQLPLGYNLSLYFNILVSGKLLLRTPFSRLEGVLSRELPLY